MENEMVAIRDVQYPLTAMAVLARVRLIQEVMNAVMKKDTHYGVIPGCVKPSLWKPGAEQLLVTFRISTEQFVEDLSTPDEARYRVSRRGTSNGEFVGSAVGECSSNEEKYKWRGSVCDAEFEATSEDRRRLKYKRDGTTIKQIRTNPADVANTVLKMADKRATVALALNATAASDCFSQDLEDLPEEVRESVAGAEPGMKPIAKPVSKDKPSGNTLTFVPTAVSIKDGEGSRGPWKKYSIKDASEFYGTFDTTLGEIAQKALSDKTAITLTWEMDKTGKYKNVLTLDRSEPVEA